jgi:hypothetical protein
MQVTCDNCGTEFDKPPGKIHDTNFCKRECAIEYRTEHPNGKGQKQRRGWRPAWKNEGSVTA